MVSKFKILFVCMGNICRSAAGEGVLKKMIEDRQLADQVECDSCGVISYHVGEKADSRMRSHSEKRGYQLLSIARQFAQEDFDEFNLILTMDKSNYVNVMDQARNEADKQKVVPFCTYVKKLNYSQVPDPYYGGADGFDLVLDILEEGCHNILEEFTRT